MASFEDPKGGEGGDNIPEYVAALIHPAASSAGMKALLARLLQACRVIGSDLRACEYSSEQVGTQNDFGDNQLQVDVKCDEVLFAALTASKVCHVASSEESPTEVSCGGEGYSVAFDPLDGSSIVDCNFAVGTIIGVWPGNGLKGRYGKEQVFSMMVQYGPRVTVALALNGSSTSDGRPISMELTLHKSSWQVTIPKFTIDPKGSTFAPGNLRATSDNEQYRALVQFWIMNKYTLRYSGGLVPDVYHILVKKQGVLANASSKTCKAKLRLLFEAAPIALIIEAAGGSSCVCASEAAEACLPVSILDVEITDLDKRIGVCYGSTEEVERFKSYIF